MKKYTEEEALAEIFTSKHLSAKVRVCKTRYANGKLSQKIVKEILGEFNFTETQKTLYIKQ